MDWLGLFNSITLEKLVMLQRFVFAHLQYNIPPRQLTVALFSSPPTLFGGGGGGTKLTYSFRF